jgi:hypothetical protein
LRNPSCKLGLSSPPVQESACVQLSTQFDEFDVYRRMVTAV